ncbi:MAG TPA: NlpC/P60 family protein, partial [Kineosporiaceae bacterium]|nr:NlpC/P60 family protein [Kineosporiaceae bacterium]
PADAIPSQASYDCALANQMSAALASGRITGSLTDLMLAAYNAGPGTVLAAGGVPTNQETRSYVARISTQAAGFSDTTGSTLPVGPFATRFLAAASSQSGVPYAWAGGDYTGPTEGSAQGRGTVGFDCSGLVLYAAYQASGGTLRLPHSADLQTRTGTAVPLDRLQPGDVISFTRAGEAAAHHVGIYAGNNTMINAPDTGSMVQTTPLNVAYWKGQQWRAVRFSA